MLEYNRIDISEGIDINKTDASKECKICHYWYFKDIGLNYEPYLCNCCHGLMRKAISFNPANIRLDEDVLKTSFVFVFRRRLQDVLIKTNSFVLATRL